LNGGEEVQTVSNVRPLTLGVLLGVLAFGQAKQGYSIDGTIKNARSGEPTQDVLVSIAKMPTESQINNPISGEPWDPHAQEARSGPRGEFRFEGLPAGVYVYEALRSGFELYRGFVTVPVVSPDAPIQVSLAPLGVAESDVGNKPDEQPHSVFRISGKIQGHTAPEAVTFELLRGTDQIRRDGGGQFFPQTGEFEVAGVAPGEYRLRVAQGKMRGEARVNIANADVSSVSIALIAPYTVRGIMRSVGGRADAIRYPNPCNVNLSKEWPPKPDAVHVPNWQQDGQFTLDNVFPGEYQVRFFCFGAYVQSASFGGVDLVRNPAVMIPADSSAPSLEINYTPGGGALQATFKDPAVPFEAVLLVPDFPAANGAELQRVKRVSVTSPAANGPEWAQPNELLGAPPNQDMFQFSNLTPGDYTIYTFPKFEDVELRNPAFLRALSGGIRTRIEDGEVTQLTIRGNSSTPTARRVPFN
jgi:hypothetical protein